MSFCHAFRQTKCAFWIVWMSAPSVFTCRFWIKAAASITDWYWQSAWGPGMKWHLWVSLGKGHVRLIDFHVSKLFLFSCMDLSSHDIRCKLLWTSNVPQAPVPLSIFRSHSKFNENSECSSFEYTRPTTTICCTRHDSDTAETCAKYRCDRPRIFSGQRGIWLLHFFYDIWPIFHHITSVMKCIFRSSRAHTFKIKIFKFKVSSNFEAVFNERSIWWSHPDRVICWRTSIPWCCYCLDLNPTASFDNGVIHGVYTTHLCGFFS